MAKSPKRTPKAKPGRKAKSYRIIGMSFADALKQSMQKSKPPGGWPKK